MSTLDSDTRTGHPPPREAGLSVHLTGVIHLYRQAGSDIVALRGVDLDIASGEMVALLGPSGMGKSTVLRVMAGLLMPSAGTVRIGERDLRRMSLQERRSLRAGEIGHIVQGTTLNVLPFATALENVWFAQHPARARGRVPPWEPQELLEMLELQHLAQRRVAELPLGLQQQVAVAAGVGPAPRLVLADEPTAQLSDEASAEVVRLLQRVNSQLGTTVVIVTHDPKVASLFPRTVTIRDGRVGAEGRQGQDYAVIDGSGSVQLPPDVLEILPPNTRVRVVRGPHGVELRDPETEE
jgi:putative ABC transport system ATP-binding protein